MASTVSAPKQSVALNTHPSSPDLLQTELLASHSESIEIPVQRTLMSALVALNMLLHRVRT